MPHESPDEMRDESHTAEEIDAARRALQTPRAAAIAGIAFALLMGTAVALMRWAIPADPADAGEWLTDDTRRRSFEVALQLVPFAGIAFLWFIGVVRTRIGDAEDRFFATVFLGSGLLLIAMLFATAAVGAGLVGTSGAELGQPDPEVWEFGREATWTLTNVYAMRMAAVFAISTTTIGLRLGFLPRWLGILGFITAAALLVGGSASAWLTLAFPAWVLVLSVHILVVDLRRSHDGTDGLGAPRAAG